MTEAYEAKAIAFLEEELEKNKAKQERIKGSQERANIELRALQDKGDKDPCLAEDPKHKERVKGIEGDLAVLQEESSKLSNEANQIQGAIDALKSKPKPKGSSKKSNLKNTPGKSGKDGAAGINGKDAKSKPAKECKK
jgi:chromosome segregation ATPase